MRLQIIFQPLQLLAAKHSQPALFDIHRIDQADEMHALLVETIPTGALRAFAKPLAVQLSVIIDDVMLSRHVEYLAAFALFENLLKRIEFLRFSEMGEIASVQHKRRAFG